MTQPSFLDMQSGVAKLVGPDHVRAATADDAIDELQPSVVVEPASDDEVAGVLSWANDHGLAVAPRGGGTKLTWGNPPARLDVIISTSRLNELVEHADGDMTATVQAGMTVAAFQRKLAERGQVLAIDAANADRTTIGGLIATNDSGALRIRYGGVRDQLLGLTFVRADGVIAHGGGRVVKNVAGYDLPKLLTGSLGSLGVITQATFRVYPCSSVTRSVRVQVDTLNTATTVVAGLLSSTLMPTGLTVRSEPGIEPEVLVRFGGISASVDAQLATLESMLAAMGCRQRVLDDATTIQVWDELAEAPWSGGNDSIVMKLSVLPTEIGPAIEKARDLAAGRGWTANTYLHGHGLGYVRWEAGGSDAAEIIRAVEALREYLAPEDGTAVVLRAPLPVKRLVDVWGPSSDAVPLMRCVKAELDPRATLNPGRLIGGI